MKTNEEKKKVTPAQQLLAIVLVIGATWLIAHLLNGGVESSVAEDAVKQYNITRQHGDTMDICVHAQLVSAAYLQAKDEKHYAEWKNTERADCAVAGLPAR